MKEKNVPGNTNECLLKNLFQYNYIFFYKIKTS